MIFCDTSALAKLYVPEPETAAIRALVESGDEVCLSELARVELMSVFHRRLHEGKWSHSDFLTTVGQFTHDDTCGFWRWLPLDNAIIDASAKTFTTLPLTAFLRASDCLHLVTALHNDFSTIYTYDAHQARASRILGLAAVAP